MQSGVKDVGTTSKRHPKEVNALGGVADKATGGAISGFKALKGTVTGAIKQFGVLRLAVAATGIGAWFSYHGSKSVYKFRRRAK